MRSVDEEDEQIAIGADLSPEALSALAEQASPSTELWEAKQVLHG